MYSAGIQCLLMTVAVVAKELHEAVLTLQYLFNPLRDVIPLGNFASTERSVGSAARQSNQRAPIPAPCSISTIHRVVATYV
jgi:hypothetical protein